MNALDEMVAKLELLTPEERFDVLHTAHQFTKDLLWVPNPGPQTAAFYCLADELFYGGEAGGGKTDLLLGTSLSSHRRSLLLRRLNGEVAGLYERLEQILGHKKGFSASPSPIWRFPGRQIRFGGVQYLDDRKKHQGTPNDLIGFDEIANFLELQYRFIIAWNRSTFPGQRSRVIVTGNPPTNAEGQWVIGYWGPWLDKNHPNPAVDGELRWFTTVDDKDQEIFDVELDEHGRPGPVIIDGVPLLDNKGKPIYPRSRTFIRAELSDNPDLEETNYGSNLMALPAILRSAMAEGDFSATQADDAFQVIPTEHVEAAMRRWSEQGRRSPMNALGVDIAGVTASKGGGDRFVMAPRHGMWFDHLKVYPGGEVPDGPTGAGLIFSAMRDSCEVIIDMGGGHGGSVRDHLRQIFSPTLYLGSESADGMRDRSGIMKFYNIRAASTWFFKEALDPDYGSFMALPPDPELKADLCALKWKWSGGKVLIQSKDEIKALIGRSPDRGDAVIMAHFAKGKTGGTRSGIGTLQTRVTTSGRNPRPGAR